MVTTFESKPTLVTSFDLRHLQFAISAADQGSFRRAAEVLSVRQSTLSRAIGTLEHLLGAKLFERSTGGVVPTPAGRSVLRMARMVLDEYNTLLTTARARSNGADGRLAIGFCTSLSAGNLRASLTEFNHRYPRIELATAEKSRDRLFGSLRNGTLDLAIVPGAEIATDSGSLALWSERIFLTLPKDHKLTERDVVYWTDLRGETVLLSNYDPGAELELLLNSKLVSANDRPLIQRHDVSRGVIKSLIAMRMGIGLMLESDLGANFATLVYRELRDGTGPTRLSFSAGWQKDNDNPALGNFVQLLTERYPLPDACG